MPDQPDTSPELGQLDIVKVIHADGTEGTAKLRVIGVERRTTEPPPHDFQAARAARAAEQQGQTDANV